MNSTAQEVATTDTDAGCVVRLASLDELPRSAIEVLYQKVVQAHAEHASSIPFETHDSLRLPDAVLSAVFTGSTALFRAVLVEVAKKESRVEAVLAFYLTCIAK